MNYSSRRLTRSRNDRMLAGVCGGVAEYLNMDPTLLRVLVAAIAVFTGFFPVVVVYLIMMLVLPEAKPGAPSSIGHQQSGFQPGPYAGGYRAESYRKTEDPVWGAEGAPWEQKSSAESPAPAPRSSDDLFSRAKHPSQPSQPAQPSEQKPTESTEESKDS